MFRSAVLKVVFNLRQCTQFSEEQTISTEVLTLLIQTKKKVSWLFGGWKTCFSEQGKLRLTSFISSLVVVNPTRGARVYQNFGESRSIYKQSRQNIKIQEQKSVQI